MYCDNCGLEIEEGENFCNECGMQIEIKERRFRGESGILKKVVIGVGIVVVLIFGIAMFTGSSDNNEYVMSIKGGSFASYPEISIGEAFDNFFSGPKWKHFVSDKGDDIVEFTGDCMFKDANVEVLIQFKLHEDGGFETAYFSMNDVSQSLLMMAGMIEAVMDDYNE